MDDLFKDEKEEEAFKAFYKEQLSSKEKLMQVMKEAVPYCLKEGMLTRAQRALIVVNHPKSRKIVNEAMYLYLLDQFLQKIGKLPKEEE